MTTKPLCIAAAALLFVGVVTGCSEQRMRRWHDRGHADRADRRVDLNSASRRDLARLPGLTDGDADRIIAARPYGAERALVRKRVLTEAQYDRVKDLVYVARQDRSDRD